MMLNHVKRGGGREQNQVQQPEVQKEQKRGRRKKEKGERQRLLIEQLLLVGVAKCSKIVVMVASILKDMELLNLGARLVATKPQ